MFKLTPRSVNLLLLAGFFGLRLSSLLTAASPLWQNGLSALALLTMVVIFYRRRQIAFLIVLTEILLGGAGIFWQLFDLSLRNSLVVVYLLLYFIDKLVKGQRPRFSRNIWSMLPLIFFIWLAVSAVIGWRAGHSLKFIYQDLSPFLLWLLYWPLKEFLRDEVNRFRLLTGMRIFLLAEALWTGLNFLLFRLGLTHLHEPYYNWLRDIAAAKITEVNQFYWRIVFPEHLLVVPLILIFSAYWLKHQKPRDLWPIIAGTLILSLNISRAFLLGWLLGLLILKLFNSRARWFKLVAINVLSFFIFFSAINLISSGGRYLGLNNLGLKFVTALAPQLASAPNLDISADIRRALLPPIVKLITEQPVVGQGLGETVTYEKSGQTFTTRSFDWGYLEMWAKWGLIGLLVYLAIILGLVKKLWLRLTADKEQALWSGLLATWLALLAINLTTPSFFHVLGIFCLVMTLSLLAPFNFFRK